MAPLDLEIFFDFVAGTIVWRQASVYFYGETKYTFDSSLQFASRLQHWHQIDARSIGAMAETYYAERVILALKIYICIKGYRQWRLSS